ncbi:OmpL47-type beta-barrel domain-containing protein [Flammeovirga kamogawensis]|uniref:Ig-like domain-containing protein n=1 Tax=Flammeovirga kamogawensis TaxID=373891 RepID=A0ABX8GZA1_9BACT|nr:hypothetical protein [Flammeovirga kamogawensis]MBB6459317.1 hypothetical protein [Flammeovirga kamogawensis]QWG08876.1 hypothetical protein KM029_08020 [Flammeovirga kamogawensis]TRX67166.1 hypothetical protein EO216_03065 [Flammeovirga kamogawensis]
MKYLLLLPLTIGLLSSYNIYGQSPQKLNTELVQIEEPEVLLASNNSPERLHHTKSVYVDNSGTYINKSLPLYLNFTTSKEEGSVSYSLNESEEVTPTDGLYLDTEGPNYIRSKWAVDPNSKEYLMPKREVKYEVIADSKAPVSKISFDGTRLFDNGVEAFYGKNLLMHLEATDKYSGVDKIFYSLDGENFHEYTSSMNLETEGQHIVYYYSADHVGNPEEVRTSTFKIDLTAPESSYTWKGLVYNENILSPNTTLRLSSEDAMSGLDHIEFSYDNSAFEEFTYQPITLNNLKDGEHTIHYKAFDLVDNEEVEKTITFYLDKIAPETSHEIIGDQYVIGSTRYVSSRTTFSIATSDNKAGVKNVFYSTNRGNNYTPYTGTPFTLKSELGKHTIMYKASDNVNNQAVEKTVEGTETLFMDNISPTTSLMYIGNKFEHRDTLFITSKTQIRLMANDSHSKVKDTFFTLNAGDEKEYSGAFTVKELGDQTLHYRSIDNVNNEEAPVEEKFFVDNDGPEIHYNMSIEPIGKHGEFDIYPSFTKLYLGATDAHVGTKEIRYSINGAAMQLYSSGSNLDISEKEHLKKDQHYKIKVVATDNLGNETKKTVEFYVGQH